MEEKEASILDVGGMAGQAAFTAFPGGFDAESGGEPFEVNQKFADQIGRAATELALLEPYMYGASKLLKAADLGIGVLAERFAPSVVKIDKNISGAVKLGMSKGVKPSVGSAGGDAGKMSNYFNQSEKAVVNIIASSEGKLPKTLEEFSEAIYSTKKSVHHKYSTMAQEAGGKGAEVSLAPIRSDLNKIIEQPNVLMSEKKLAEDMLFELSAYEEIITPGIAEDLISKFNAQNRAFWKNPNFNDVKKAVVTERTATQLRKATDKSISAYQGPGYQELKREYGALSAIEKDVAQRATVDLRKNVKGFYDLADVASAGEFRLGTDENGPVPDGFSGSY